MKTLYFYSGESKISHTGVRGANPKGRESRAIILFGHIFPKLHEEREDLAGCGVGWGEVGLSGPPISANDL